MADTNIPAWLAALQAQQAPVGGSGWSPGASYTDPSGSVYNQAFATSANGGDAGANNQTFLNGYTGQDAANAALNRNREMSQFSSYDLNGNHTMDFTNNPKDGLTPQQWALMMGAALAGGYGLNAALGGAAAGAGTPALSNLSMADVLAQEGAASGAAGLGGAGAGIGGAGGAAGAAAGGVGTMAPMSLVPSSLADVGALPTVSGMGGTAASLLGKYGGLGASLLGAAMGAQGQKTSQTSDRKTDPRVDPYLFGGNGDPGLLGYTQQQLARDMSPERRAQIDSMLSKGMGLLNQPVAGNGFGLFTKGKY